MSGIDDIIETPDEVELPDHLKSSHDDVKGGGSAEQSSPFEDSWLLKEHRNRLQNNRDLKVVIVARDADRGVGKTTLAVHLCRIFDLSEEGWNVEKAVVGDVDEYTDLYEEHERKSCLLLDEAEEAAYARRAMAEENRKANMTWAKKRQWQMSSIFTLPSSSQLDKGLREMADVVIICYSNPVGRARVYKVKVDDISGKIWLNPKEEIEFDDLDGDDDYMEMSRMKEEEASDKEEDEDEQTVDAQEMAASLKRNKGDLSPAQIAEMIPPNDNTGEQYSRQTVRRWLDDADLLD